MTKMLKFKLPKKVVKEYNETNKEISRLMGTQTYYQMQRDGSFRTVLLPKRKYSLGIDWEPYGKKGTITILFEEEKLRYVETTIHIQTTAKNDFDKIVNSIAKSYDAQIFKEI
jgi:hypothetical protein